MNSECRPAHAAIDRNTGCLRRREPARNRTLDDPAQPRDIAPFLLGLIGRLIGLAQQLRRRTHRGIDRGHPRLIVHDRLVSRSFSVAPLTTERRRSATL